MLMKTGESLYEISISLDGCMNDPTADDAYELIRGKLEEAETHLRDIGITSVTMDLLEKRRVQ
jgi:hypothetical protein